MLTLKQVNIAKEKLAALGVTLTEETLQELARLLQFEKHLAAPVQFTVGERIIMLSALALDLTTNQEAVKRNPSLIDVAEKRLAIIQSLEQKIMASVEA